MSPDPFRVNWEILAGNLLIMIGTVPVHMTAMHRQRNRRVRPLSIVDPLMDELVWDRGGLLATASDRDILLELNLRHHWRGFSFGRFWFGYYFSNPSSRTKWRTPPPV
jgi:hypothetical protein